MFQMRRKAEAALEQKPEEGSAARDDSAPRGGLPTTGAATLNALLGPGSVVEGKVSFQGQVRIDGRFTGEITTTDLLIKLYVLYNSLPDSEEEAKARYEALIPVLQGELAWLAAYQPKTPRA